VNVHPSRYFIKYLLVAQEDISQASINSTLELHGMAEVDVKELGRIRQDLGDFPSWLRVWDRKDKKTNAWLRKHRIHSLVHPDRATHEMKEQILPDQKLRRHVESLLLGRVGEREMSFRLKKLGYRLSDVAISEYRHYFWNTFLLGINDWAEYFEKDESKQGTGRTAIGQHIYSAALYAGPEVALYRAGIRKEIDSKVILLDVQRELYHTFLEIKALPLSAKKVEMLSTVSRGLARIDERVQSGDTALLDVLKKFEKFRVLHDTKALPSLMDLAPTGSVSKKSRAEINSSKDVP